jgi:hypothetical protein
MKLTKREVKILHRAAELIERTDTNDFPDGLYQKLFKMFKLPNVVWLNKQERIILLLFFAEVGHREDFEKWD